MIPITTQSVLLFLHILGVTVWLGGQIVIATLVPRLRKDHPETTKLVAQQFAKIAWPSLGIIVITGIFQLAMNSTAQNSTEYMVTFALKMALVAVAIISTIVHSVGTTKIALALGGALGLLATVGATYLGVLLTTAG